MENKERKWPLEPKSIFTEGSSEETNQAFRDDPLRGFHKHGPDCKGDVQAIIYPLSLQARTCCEAEPKEHGASPLIVRLRLCKESTYFSIGTALGSNVTLKCPELVDDDDTDWRNQIQARIYSDPDSNDAELVNGSPSLTIFVTSSGNKTVHSLDPGKHFRLDASRSWSIKMTKLHTFGLILHPAEALYDTLVSDDVLRNEYKIFRLPTALKESRKMKVGCGNPRGEEGESSRQIHLSTRPDPSLGGQITNKTFEVQVALDTTLPLSSDDDPDPVVLFENNVTTVEEIGRRRVRKTIRSTCVHLAAVQYEKETRTLRGLSHPHIIKIIKWNNAEFSMEFEHGGKDLASLKSATNMFDVAINRIDVQERIWVHTASALEYLHNEKTIKHLDIKPQNILLSKDHQTVKVCDLGLARNIDEAVRGGGTPWYTAPEFLLSGETSGASDIWALGVTMLFVLNIIALPGTESGAEVWQICELKDNREERYKMRKWLDTVVEAKGRIPDKWSLLREMLDQNPETRITAKGLTQKLEKMAIGKCQRRTLLEV